MVFYSGDFRFFYPENIKDFVALPSAWDSSLNTGLGQSQLSSLWITSYFNFTAHFTRLGISWDVISLLFWVLPAIFLSFISANILFRTLFPELSKYALIAGFIYLGNTYFLMILTGGQLGVSLAYSIAPLVLAMFIKTINKPQLQRSLISSLVIAIQVLFDPRVAVVTFGIVVILLFFQTGPFALIKKRFIHIFVTPSVFIVLFHSYWVLPLIFTGSSKVLPEGYASVSGFEFFSFADFSHSLSLLHPNWPENIFGKVYFLQAEFLVLPIVAFSSLLFISKIQSKIRTILFLAFIGLLGAFLAKGANPPFGEINIWLFQQFPGMSVFRDPTKFYILIVLSYAMLIPFGLANVSNWVSSKFKVTIQNLSIIMFILFLLFLIRPMLFGEFMEKLRPREVPMEYVQLKNFLALQPHFFRTVWIPQWQRFGYFSNNHPAIGRFEILNSASPSGQIKELSKNGMQDALRQAAVKYIIVPYDSEGELFLKDRKYDEREYESTVEELKKIDWVNKVQHFGKIALFELPDPKDHFWSTNKDLEIEYEFINPTTYKVSVRNAKQGNLLVFSEGYDRYWVAEDKSIQYRVSSIQYKNFLNSFVLPKSGNYNLKIYYEPQKWVNIGLIISGITLASIVWFLVRSYRKI